ncbi:MAG: polysaccharide pyruvyl transferase family protein [Ginsengibacter sp.]
MNIELKGVSFFNKGAELMLHAIMRRVKAEMPDALFVMENSNYTTRDRHLQNGIYTKANFQRFILLRHLFNFTPGFIRKHWYYITDKEIDVVLDCSGFGFGDVWGAKKASDKLGSHIVKWKKRGKKVIMLPQAFGPFSNAELIEVMKNIITYADLIFARDQLSLKYLEQLSGDNDKLICAPDFTNLIEGTIPPSFDSSKCEVAIIVNSKMLDTAVIKDAEAYINLFYRIIGIIAGLGYKPYFLIHEVETDINVAEIINQRLATKLPVIIEDNPMHVKGIIANSVAVVTSRFHGLVSSLSQAIPCLTTNSSHKYEMLLRDYYYSEALLDVHCGDELLLKKVKSILTEPTKSIIIENLKIESLKQKQLSEEMWKQVFKEIKNN